MLAALLLTATPLATVDAAPPERLRVEGDGCLAGLEVPVVLRAPAAAKATVDGGTLTLEIRAQGEAGRRTIAVGDAPCEEVREAAALAIALALEALGAVEPAPLRTSPSPLPTAAPLVPRAAPAPRPPVAPPSILAAPGAAPDAPGVTASEKPAQLGAAVDVGLAVGATSVAALSTSVLVDAGWSPLRQVGPELSARLGLFVAWPSRMVLATDQDDVSYLSLWAGRADGCAGLGADAVRARLCGTAILGTLEGTSTQSAGYLSVGGRAELGWRATPRATLTLSGDVLSKLAPTTLTVETALGETTTAPEKNPLAIVFATGVTTDFL